MKHNLVDLYVLLIHPIILDSGRSLLREGSPYAALKLVECKTTDNEGVIASYAPA
jgi:hypothetical protein